MNIFSVLDLKYEVFHTRMLMWLWTSSGDHGAGDSYLRPFLELLNVSVEDDCHIDAEARIGASRGAQWRLADLLIRTGDVLILVENKVDPGYQDVEQILDEIDGGREIAEKERRRFIFVLIAPGPLSSGMTEALESCSGRFVSWNELVELLNGVPRSALEQTTGELIRQYLDFCKSLKSSRSGFSTPPAPDPALLRDCGDGVYSLVREYSPHETLTAVDVWPQFLEQYPDHASALDNRWADSNHYSTKAWFAARLQRMAVDGDLIEDTGEWQHSGTEEWGFPKVRVYRRLADN